jgi:hypothetical protein
MSVFINRKWLVGVLAALLSLPAMAQENELKELPGYVDFGQLEAVYGEPKVMVNIGSLLLGLATAATQNEPETAKMLSGLEGVRINVYSTEGQTAPALEQVNNVKAMLKAADWEPIVQVNEDGEQVQIFMKADGEGMQGLTVMAVDDEEAVFVNLLGAIDPQNLSEIMNKFDVDVDVD